MKRTRRNHGATSHHPHQEPASEFARRRRIWVHRCRPAVRIGSQDSPDLATPLDCRWVSGVVKRYTYTRCRRISEEVVRLIGQARRDPRFAAMWTRFWLDGYIVSASRP